MTGATCEWPRRLQTLGLRIFLPGFAEYEALVVWSDVSGHYAVGFLLESCLADKLVFIERTLRLIRNRFATKIAARAGA
jgi:hypothetical protein